MANSAWFLATAPCKLLIVGPDKDKVKISMIFHTSDCESCRLIFAKEFAIKVAIWEEK